MITNDEVRQIPLFAHLDESTIAQITAQAADVRLNTGEWVAREGEPGAFFALLSGRFAVVKLVGGKQRQLAIREAGWVHWRDSRSSWRLPSLPALKRWSRPVCCDSAHRAFRTLVSQIPALQEELTGIIQQRILGVEAVTLQADPIPLVIGTVDDLACHNMRDFLMRNLVDFDWRDPTNPADVPFIPALDPHAPYPVLILPDGAMLSCPTPEEIARAVGLATTPASPEYDVVIIGGGPSGLAAAVYGASEGLAYPVDRRVRAGGAGGNLVADRKLSGISDWRLRR